MLTGQGKAGNFAGILAGNIVISRVYGHWI